MVESAEDYSANVAHNGLVQLAMLFPRSEKRYLMTPVQARALARELINAAGKADR